MEYGAYPDQRRHYFTLRDAQPTLADKAPGAGLQGAIFQGLETLTDTLLDREWTRDGGGTMRIGRCLIDANWGASTDVVYQFCANPPMAPSSCPVTASSSERPAFPSLNIGGNKEIDKVIIGAFPVSPANALCDMSSSTPTTGNRSYLQDSP